MPRPHLALPTATCKGGGRVVCSGYELRYVCAGSGGEENSWETLAEDFFGINLGGPAGEGLVTPEDLSLDEPESSSSQAKAAKSEPAATPPQTGARPATRHGKHAAKETVRRTKAALADGVYRLAALFRTKRMSSERTLDLMSRPLANREAATSTMSSKSKTKSSSSRKSAMRKRLRAPSRRRARRRKRATRTTIRTGTRSRHGSGVRKRASRPIVPRTGRAGSKRAARGTAPFRRRTGALRSTRPSGSRRGRIPAATRRVAFRGPRRTAPGRPAAQPGLPAAGGTLAPTRTGPSGPPRV